MGFDCEETIELPIGVLGDIKEDQWSIIIVDGCSFGPEPTDTLTSKNDGYSVYKEE